MEDGAEICCDEDFIPDLVRGTLLVLGTSAPTQEQECKLLGSFTTFNLQFIVQF